MAKKAKPVKYLDADGRPIEIGAVYFAISRTKRTVKVLSLGNDVVDTVAILPLNDADGKLSRPAIDGINLTVGSLYFSNTYAKQDSDYRLLILV